MRFAPVFAALVLSLLAVTAPALAQPHRGPDLAAQQAAMARLAPLAGRWQGEALVSGAHAMTVHQTEEVEIALDGRLVIFQGTGHSTADRAGTPVFQAFGVVSYDDARQIYEMRSYAYGYAATSTGVFTADGAFVWTTPMFGQTQSRFTIRFDAETWHELGEMTRDGGATWTRTVELNLTRAR